jgi:hypothetical protein
VNFVLQTDTLAQDLCAPARLSTQSLCLLVRNPHLGQKAAGIQLRQHRRVDAVGLNLRLRDQAHQQRISNDNSRHPRLYRCCNRRRVAGCLQHDVIVALQALCKPVKCLPRHCNATAGSNLTVFQVRDLDDGMRNIQSYNSHGRPPIG